MSITRQLEFGLQIVHYLAWFPLAILVLSAILKLGVRRYPLVFAYMVAMVLSVMAQMPTALGYYRSNHFQSAWFQKLHFVCEAITYPLILAVVVSLIYLATATVATRHLIRTVVSIGAPLFTLISFAFHYDRMGNLGLWITPWTRDINFCAAILDLVLWALLLGARNKDHRLLLLTGGMGIVFAGDAVADAVRSIAIHNRSFSVWVLADVLGLIADIGWLYIWWQAFRREAAASRKAGISG